MHVGIVGGSIAGCSAANLLIRAGHNVDVFERSDRPLVGRGGGIGTTTSLLDQLKDEGLIDHDFPHFTVRSMPLTGRSPDTEPFGKSPWSIPIQFEVFQWNALWKNLRANVPDGCYHAGVKITNAVPLNDRRVELTSGGGDTYQFDLVLFADGYKSLGRAIMFPEAELKYRGYVLFRGNLDEHEMTQPAPLEDKILRLSYSGQPGHNVMYFIPDRDGDMANGKRVYNWAAYIAVPEDELDDVMTDRDGKVRKGTMPPGRIAPAIEQKLKSFLKRNTPEHYADVVEKTRGSYIQVIYTLGLHEYYRDQMCLIGDAGFVVQPFTGSGVFKGYHNVKDLLNYLEQYDDPQEALTRWSTLQVENGTKLMILGEQMEKAFIWEQPDLANLSEEAARQWWKASVTFPDTFSIERKENN